MLSTGTEPLAEPRAHAGKVEDSGPTSIASVRMAAQALALLQAGHVEASIGVYRALAQRHPELAPFCTVQIRAVELLPRT